jgi:hypothetical protein
MPNSVSQVQETQFSTLAQRAGESQYFDEGLEADVFVQVRDNPMVVKTLRLIFLFRIE